MTKALVVETDGNAYVYEHNGDYKDLQKIVGGYLESVLFGDIDCTVYMNDEAKIVGLPDNEKVTEYWYNSGQVILLGDYLAGNAIFFGPADLEGNNTDVPEHIINHFIKDKSNV